MDLWDFSHNYSGESIPSARLQLQYNCVTVLSIDLHVDKPILEENNDEQKLQ